MADLERGRTRAGPRPNTSYDVRNTKVSGEGARIGRGVGARRVVPARVRPGPGDAEIPPNSREKALEFWNLA